MGRKFSIAEARNNLPRLVREAEAGKTIEITRRGKAVAVVLSAADYANLRGDAPLFWEKLTAFWRSDREPDLASALDNVRDQSPGRSI